jgi:hypothetical protein
MSLVSTLTFALVLTLTCFLFFLLHSVLTSTFALVLTSTCFIFFLHVKKEFE